MNKSLETVEDGFKRDDRRDKQPRKRKDTRPAASMEGNRGSRNFSKLDRGERKKDPKDWKCLDQACARRHARCLREGDSKAHGDQDDFDRPGKQAELLGAQCICFQQVSFARRRCSRDFQFVSLFSERAFGGDLPERIVCAGARMLSEIRETGGGRKTPTASPSGSRLGLGSSWARLSWSLRWSLGAARQILWFCSQDLAVSAMLAPSKLTHPKDGTETYPRPCRYLNPTVLPHFFLSAPKGRIERLGSGQLGRAGRIQRRVHQ